MTESQSSAADPATAKSVDSVASLVEMQAAVQQLADTRAALRKCLAELIESSVLTWR